MNSLLIFLKNIIISSKANFVFHDNMSTIYSMWLQDVKLLMEDIAELKPTIFIAVPRVLDRVYTGKFLSLMKV